jgi:hypothetical protein
MALGIVAAGGFEELKTEEDAKRIIADLEKDKKSDNQPVMGFDFWWMWGRKPE